MLTVRVVAVACFSLAVVGCQSKTDDEMERSFDSIAPLADLSPHSIEALAALKSFCYDLRELNRWRGKREHSLRRLLDDSDSIAKLRQRRDPVAEKKASEEKVVKAKKEVAKFTAKSWQQLFSLGAIVGNPEATYAQKYSILQELNTKVVWDLGYDPRQGYQFPNGLVVAYFDDRDSNQCWIARYESNGHSNPEIRLVSKQELDQLLNAQATEVLSQE